MEVFNQVFAGVTVMAISAIACVLVRLCRMMLAMKGAQQAELRDNMLRAYRFYKTQDRISVDDKDNFSNMYLWYHALGQNGVMTYIYNEVLGMETKVGDNDAE